MKKLLSVLLLIAVIIGCVGCASEKGYEGLADKACAAMQKNDFNAWKSITDIDNVQKYAELTGLDFDKDEFFEELQEDFTDQYEKLEYEYDPGFTVSHGSIKVLNDDGYERYTLERMRKLAKLENQDEDPDVTVFVNDFVKNLNYVAVVKTNVTVKSKDGDDKERDEHTYYTYCCKGKWYMDQVGLLRKVTAVLEARESAKNPVDEG